MGATRLEFKDYNASVGGSTSYIINLEGTSFSRDWKLNEYNITKKIASLDKNSWLLEVAQDTNGTKILGNDEEVPYWTKALSGTTPFESDGYYYFPLNLTIETDSMGETFTTKGLTIELLDCAFCGSVVWTTDARDITENFSTKTNVLYINKYVENWSTLTINIRGISLPQRRIKLQNLVQGIRAIIDDDNIKILTATREFDFTGITMPYGSIEGEIQLSTEYEFALGYGIPITVYRAWDAAAGFIDVGTFYITDSEKKAGGVYSFNGVDAIGLLDNSYYPGLEFMSGMSAITIIRSILNGTGIEIINPYDSDAFIYGAIPRMTRKNALQQVIFASGLLVTVPEYVEGELWDKTADSIIINLDYHEPAVDKDNTYEGVTITREKEYTEISIDQHQFNANPEGDIQIGSQRYFDIKTTHTLSAPGKSNERQKTKSITTAYTVTSQSVNGLLSSKLQMLNTFRDKAELSVAMDDYNYYGYLRGFIDVFTRDEKYGGFVTKATYHFSNVTKVDLEVRGQ